MIQAFMYGRISSDIDMQYRNDKAVASFSIAIQKRDKTADFFRCVAFGVTAENIEKFFHKGSRISMRTVPSQPKAYTNKDGQKVYPNVNFIVQEFDFVDTKAENSSGASEAEHVQENVQPAAESDSGFMSAIDEDLPFN